MMRIWALLFVLMMACVESAIQGTSDTNSGSTSASSDGTHTATNDSSGTETPPTTGETTHGTTGTTTDSTTGSTGTTGEPCENMPFTCQELASLFMWGDEVCVPYGEEPLTNTAVAELGMGHVVAPRYRSCRGTAWEQVMLLLDGHPLQSIWLQVSRDDEAMSCEAVDLLLTLEALDGLFVYPHPPDQMGNNFKPGDQNKGALLIELCGTDENHPLNSLKVARKMGGQTCTDNLMNGDKNATSVTAAQIFTLAPYVNFENNEGEVLLVPNQPIFDPNLNDLNAVGLNLQIKVGVAGSFCIVPLDDEGQKMHYVSATPAPDYVVF